MSVIPGPFSESGTTVDWKLFNPTSPTINDPNAITSARSFGVAGPGRFQATMSSATVTTPGVQSGQCSILQPFADVFPLWNRKRMRLLVNVKRLGTPSGSSGLAIVGGVVDSATLATANGNAGGWTMGSGSQDGDVGVGLTVANATSASAFFLSQVTTSFGVGYNGTGYPLNWSINGKSSDGDRELPVSPTGLATLTADLSSCWLYVAILRRTVTSMTGVQVDFTVSFALQEVPDPF